jgi:uncharacterized membrane protein YfcA
MDWTLSTFLLANAILIVSSILQMATGVSVGLIIVPFLAMISYTLVPVPVIFGSLALTMMMAYQGREHIDKTNMSTISLGMIGGIFIGLYLLTRITFEYLGVVFGLLILLSIALSLKFTSFKLSPMINISGGLVAGVMGTMAAVGGQILALLFQNHALASIKATLALLYTLFSVVMLLTFFIAGAFSYDQLVSGFLLMPGFFLGFLIAPFFSHYFNPVYAKPTVLILATFGSLFLIGKTLYQQL